MEQREVFGGFSSEGSREKVMGFVMLGAGIRVLKTEAPFYYL